MASPYGVDIEVDSIEAWLDLDSLSPNGRYDFGYSILAAAPVELKWKLKACHYRTNDYKLIIVGIELPENGMASHMSYCYLFLQVTLSPTDTRYYVLDTFNVDVSGEWQEMESKIVNLAPTALDATEVQIYLEGDPETSDFK